MNRRMLWVALLALAASLVVVAPATAAVLEEEGDDICACYDPPPPPPPPQPPAPPPPPPPPPPELDAELWTGDFVADPSPYEFFGTTRCKIQTFTQNFSQAGLFKVITYKGMFRVCYRHNAGIVSFSDVHGDATWTRAPWTWKGNDNGYPYGVKYARRVDFHYRGTAAICFFNYGCGPEKHPWVTLTFYDNNTMTRRAGVT